MNDVQGPLPQLNIQLMKSYQLTTHNFKDSKDVGIRYHEHKGHLFSTLNSTIIHVTNW